MGEVFVLDDGGEVDLDFGNYESFLNICLTKDNNITTGKIYKKIEFDERQGKYLGKCVQIVPHFTTAIKEWVEEVAKRPVDGTNHRPDIVIVELGGTADDMESSPFMNALADFTHPDHCSRFMHIHVSLLIDLKSSGEVKTKPLQRSVEVTRRFGLLPDIIICRSERQISMAIKEKIANSCRIKLEQVIGVQDVTNIFRVPLLLMQQNILDGIKIRLNLSSSPAATALKNCPNILQWTQLADL
uniref:CTP synthase N-terminal domain-containing protein n=1 Tax=Panagrolaimus sp. PS1159 TaxID=55785 RepID=A0AC35FZY9_9BILA